MIYKAERFAELMHQGQKRKYTGEPYIEHPRAVVKLIIDHTEWATEEMVSAAYLHDVVEDTAATIDDIEAFFGKEVRDLVFWLTDQSKPDDGNRKERKKIDRDHIARAPDQAKTIKIADLIDNTKSIAKHDKKFAKVYLQEKRFLLDVLKGGNQLLYAMALNQLTESLVEVYE